jgi:DNA-binding XRE family transcriptional regulator
MENIANWVLTEEEKEKCIAALTPELSYLRSKAGVSQDELAALIGTTRQTYGAIERNSKKMSWSMFLSLIMFYDYNVKTHQMIRSIGAFPNEVVKVFNGGADIQNMAVSPFLDEGMESIVDRLDEQALRSIRAMIMIEYARCTDMPGEAVVKSFDGQNFKPVQMPRPELTDALKSIKGRNRR